MLQPSRYIRMFPKIPTLFSFLWIHGRPKWKSKNWSNSLLPCKVSLKADLNPKWMTTYFTMSVFAMTRNVVYFTISKSTEKTRHSSETFLSFSFAISWQAFRRGAKLYNSMLSTTHQIKFKSSTNTLTMKTFSTGGNIQDLCRSSKTWIKAYLWLSLHWVKIMSLSWKSI